MLPQGTRGFLRLSQGSEAGSQSFGMMLIREALNIIENDTVCAMPVCVKLLDGMRALLIMPMWEKSTATRWPRYTRPLARRLQER